MDDDIFDQLDQLERDPHLGRHSGRIHNEQIGFAGGEDDSHRSRHRHRAYEREEEVEDESELRYGADAFDEALLRQPSVDNHHRQPLHGQARLSLPRSRTQVDDDHASYYDHIPLPALPSSPPRFDRDRYIYSTGQELPSSPPSFGDNVLVSSVSFTPTPHRPVPPSRMQPFKPVRTLNCQPAEQQMAAGRRQTVSQDKTPAQQTVEASKPRYDSRMPQSRAVALVVQGITLVATHEVLPDRFRAIFPYPLFNAVQSKCFRTIYESNDNMVLSAPTGAGKTVMLELAICRLINGHSNGSFKIIYQAPTKALCAERQRDWQAKFGPLDLQCAELTGDSDHAQLRNVQQASIIITTPEKWDSMTRKWKDHQRLMQMVKLFLIDEVHILKEDRGATLEAVVSRMKSVGSNVRFVALSATVPNADDIATWLGKDSETPSLPAVRERFGEEFRPVRLVKHVAGYQSTNINDFAFEKVLNGKLTEVITKWGKKKPIMVFCFTRSSCSETAKLLANWWKTGDRKNRHWSSPCRPVAVADKDLRDTIIAGVAFHHAGLSFQDRQTIEKAYLQGDVNVICCTSTLAVGVNLPCHMVIIKNTVSYQSNATGCKEYSDLEVMQMLGRAGRPQFDDSGVAVIMTRHQKVGHYEKMITGQEVLESCLHRNLIDHLNAEIGLGTITSVSSAKQWLAGTFLYVRLKQNPEYYRIEDDAPGVNLDERLENICTQGVAQLEDNRLVLSSGKLRCTEIGDAMARYYVQFQTMKTFISLPPKAKVSEILSAIAQAAEFRDIRFRAGEKTTYKDLNKDPGIRFPIPVNLDAPAHKVSLVLQAALGCVDLPTSDTKQTTDFSTTRGLIFQHASRLIRCIIDCQLHLEDSIGSRNALMLARSFGAQVWDNSPLHMKQLESVGIVAVRKFVAAGITSIEELENASYDRIERSMSRNPPYGKQIQDKAKAFPKLRVSVKMVGEPLTLKAQGVTVKLNAQVGFLNDKVPEVFHKFPINVCLLIETSDGRKVHFVRISARKLHAGQEIMCNATLSAPNQTVRASVMCDNIAGTLRQALLKPDVPSAAFPLVLNVEGSKGKLAPLPHTANTSKRRTSYENSKPACETEVDEFGDADIADEDLAAVECAEFIDIDQLDDDREAEAIRPPKKKQRVDATTSATELWKPKQLPNGKWACNHPCKDKTTCKHLCCREGLDKKPKPPKTKDVPNQAESKSDPRQTQLSVPISKSRTPSISHMTTGHQSVRQNSESNLLGRSKEINDLNRLHGRTTKTASHLHLLGKLKPPVPPSHSRLNDEISSVFDRASFSTANQRSAHDVDEFYSTGESEDLPEINELFNAHSSEGLFDQDRKGEHHPKGVQSQRRGHQRYGIADVSSKVDSVDLSSSDDRHRSCRTDTDRDEDDIMEEYVFDSAKQQETRRGEMGKHSKVRFQPDSFDEDELRVLDDFGKTKPLPEDGPPGPPDPVSSSSSRYFDTTQPQPRHSDDSAAGQLNEIPMKHSDITINGPVGHESAVPNAGLGKQEHKGPQENAVEQWFESHFGTDLFNIVE